MKKSGLLIVLAIITLIVLAACQSTVSSSVDTIGISTSTATPMESPTDVRPTSTPMLLPTDTPTPIPTNTFTPSTTDTPTPVATNTATPTETTTSVPTSPPAPAESLLEITPSPEPVEQDGNTEENTPVESIPSSRTVRVGLHGRNDVFFQELDYQLIREARIEMLKMMSLTDPLVFARIKQENPDIDFIVRLYDDRINADGHPAPQEYANKMIPIMQSLQPYVVKFEIGNEPNHVHRYEGWGSEDADAVDFNGWFLEVYGLLKDAHPWAELGFPALATPNSYHRDRAWLEFTHEAINRADWLGVHCYWQAPPNEASTMFDEERGLCFQYYHQQFPDKALEITEFDNDNVIWDIPPSSAEEIARQYVTYYQELFKYPYIRSASSFIMSSPDRRWDYFAWRTEDSGFKPVVTKIANMARPELVK